MDYFHVHASILSIFLVTPPSRLEIRCIWGLVLIQAPRISAVYTALNGSLGANPHLSNIPQSRPPSIPRESSVKELSGNLCLYWLPICQRFLCETSSLFGRFSLCGVSRIWIRFLPLFKCGSVSPIETYNQQYGGRVSCDPRTPVRIHWAIVLIINLIFILPYESTRLDGWHLP